MTLPYLNISGADVFEHPGFLFGSYPELNHIIAGLMLKLKLLVDIRNLKITRKILTRRRLPSELWEPIELAVVRSPLSAKLQKDPTVSLLMTEMTLLKQIRLLGAALVKANHGFMFSLFKPDEALSAEPETYQRGSWDEMALAMQYSYATWWEMEGVLDILNDARACAARDPADEIEDMMEGETFMSNSGLDRTAQELLEDVSINRIWGYLDYAIENASWLGPWSKRPSERHFREVREFSARVAAEDAESEYTESDESEAELGL